MLDGRHTGTGGGNHVTLGGATRGRQPVAPPPRRAAQPHHLLAEPSGAVVSLLRARSSARPARRRASTRRATTTSTSSTSRSRSWSACCRRRRSAIVPGWSIACCATCSSTSPATRTAPSSRIDKLYSPDGASRPARPRRVPRVRDAAARADEPAARCCSCARSSRASGASRYRAALIPWGTRAARSLDAAALRGARHPRRRRATCGARGTRFEERWLAPFVEFRFPRYGTVVYEGVELELRQAIEPWHVLGRGGGTAPAPRATSTRRSSACRCGSAGLDRRSARGHVQRAAAAAARHRRARRVRRRRALPRVGRRRPRCIRPSACTRR